MKAFSMTDTGALRDMNQDYYFVSETPVGNLPNLFIVADGMGGHQAGDYASRYTIERIVASVLRNKGDEPVAILREAIRKANEILVVESREDVEKRGMGTTVVAATFFGEKMIVANVGDSRLYVVSGQIRQITRDHSLVEEMVRMGEMKPQEAKKHPDKNVITRAIGAADSVKVDFFEVELKQGELVLLCSDGLTNMVDDDTIRKIMRDTDSLEEIVRILIQAANDRGGQDNITAIVIKPFSDEVTEC